MSGQFQVNQSALFQNYRTYHLEAESKEVIIHDDPFIATKMIDYLYYAGYDDSPDKDPPKYQECPNTAEYESEELGTTGSDNEYDIAQLRFGGEKLESNLQQDWEDTEFIPIVEYTYGPECPKQSDLQSIITKYSIQHLSTLKESHRFHEVLKQFPEFGYDFSVLAMEKVIQLEVQLRPNQSPPTTFKHTRTKGGDEILIVATVVGHLWTGEDFGNMMRTFIIGALTAKLISRQLGELEHIVSSDTEVISNRLKQPVFTEG
ncbi:hypothetical protein FE257_000685 [Aspergillus nanangensis]|uniref:Uncharacterized protein n=1 Tax=Aspergillus nanangensis TaxID=2582783 RepID=A0AAD4CEU5_ASPNN|nr:hypothetical protein FE257_000685 [Aspergillus nanangensis]